MRSDREKIKQKKQTRKGVTKKHYRWCYANSSALKIRLATGDATERIKDKKILQICIHVSNKSID
jgi:hypothetical protein